MGQIDDARDMLVRAFPHCFVPSGFPKKPLMRGMDRELARRGVMTQSRANQFLRVYCNGPRYLRALIEGTQRVGLDGAPAGGISDEERERARAALHQLECQRQVARDRRRFRLEAERRAGALRRVRPLLDAIRSGDKRLVMQIAGDLPALLAVIDEALEPWAGRPPRDVEEQEEVAA